MCVSKSELIGTYGLSNKHLLLINLIWKEIELNFICFCFTEAEAQSAEPSHSNAQDHVAGE